MTKISYQICTQFLSSNQFPHGMAYTKIKRISTVIFKRLIKYWQKTIGMQCFLNISTSAKHFSPAHNFRVDKMQANEQWPSQYQPTSKISGMLIFMTDSNQVDILP